MIGGWGVYSDQEIYNGSCVRDPVAGLFIVISAPGGCRALLVWCLTLLRNELKSGSVRSWMIPGDSWMSSGEY